MLLELKNRASPGSAQTCWRFPKRCQGTALQGGATNLCFRSLCGLDQRRDRRIHNHKLTLASAWLNPNHKSQQPAAFVIHGAANVSRTETSTGFYHSVPAKVCALTGTTENRSSCHGPSLQGIWNHE